MHVMNISLPRIGVLGGMGPLATADFFSKLVRATPAARDQDHFPVSLESAPQIPDRISALEGHGPDPLPDLLAVARRLVDAGCALIAMPCNTAHLWHGKLAAELPVPFLHIADAAAQRLNGARRVGLMGTTATLRSRLYQDRIGGRIEWVLPTDAEMEQAVMPGVNAIKGDRLDEGRALLLPVVHRLATQGIDALVLGCTEIPLAIAQADTAVPVIDATQALAEAAVEAAQGLQAAGVRAAA